MDLIIKKNGICKSITDFKVKKDGVVKNANYLYVKKDGERKLFWQRESGDLIINLDASDYANNQLIDRVNGAVWKPWNNATSKVVKQSDGSVLFNDYPYNGAALYTATMSQFKLGKLWTLELKFYSDFSNTNKSKPTNFYFDLCAWAYSPLGMGWSTAYLDRKLETNWKLLGNNSMSTYGITDNPQTSGYPTAGVHVARWKLVHDTSTTDRDKMMCYMDGVLVNIITNIPRCSAYNFSYDSLVNANNKDATSKKAIINPNQAMSNAGWSAYGPIPKNNRFYYLKVWVNED